MTNATIPTVPKIYTPFEQQPDKHLPECTLKWRQGQLLAKQPQQVKQPQVPLLKSEQSLVECLKCSPVKLLRIDPDLGETGLRLWADACEQANKPVFLRIPATQELPRQRSLLRPWLNRLLDWSAAALLLLALSPVMLGLVLLWRVHAPGPIFCREWHIGERGKLFRLLKFRTDAPLITLLGRWMGKYSLYELPQLFNVLRGEMSLVGPRPWTLHDAVRISPEKRQQMNALPGITGA
jgi:hypothetical protein